MNGLHCCLNMLEQSFLPSYGPQITVHSWFSNRDQWSYKKAEGNQETLQGSG